MWAKLAQPTSNSQNPAGYGAGLYQLGVQRPPNKPLGVYVNLFFSNLIHHFGGLTRMLQLTTYIDG